MFIGCIIIASISYYALSGLKQDSNMKSITETLRTTAISNRDDSSRIERGQFKLMQSNFESDFKKKFSNTKNLKAEVTSYDFDYLSDGKGGVKAIKVIVVSEKKTYQATCVLNVSS